MAAHILADGSGYPLLDVFWTLLWIFLWVVWIFLLIRILNDVFRSRDLSGVAKAAWTIGLILFPLLAGLVYLIVRGAQMHEREAAVAAANEKAAREYLRSALGTSSSGVADDLSRLADLRERGAITDEEFQTLKGRLLSSQ